MTHFNIILPFTSNLNSIKAEQISGETNK